MGERMPAGPARLTLNPHIIREMTRVAQNPDQLSAIISAVTSLGPQPGIAVMAGRVAEVGGMSEDEVRRSLYTLQSIYNVQHSLGLNAEEAVAAITEEMAKEASTEKDKEDLLKWKKAESKIVEVIKSITPEHALLATEKAGRVLFAHQSLLTEAKLYTDIRPVFNDRADSIVQSVVTHVLALEYESGDAERQLLITLDASDVSALKRACQRAEQKAAVIKQAFKDMPWPTFVFHEPERSESAGTESGED
jgi:electron transfer flavoprotein alpha subunit